MRFLGAVNGLEPLGTPREVRTVIHPIFAQDSQPALSAWYLLRSAPLHPARLVDSTGKL
jgi:hypothetical protein